MRLQVVQGDITKLAVTAIVNAANTSLLGGGGVDGAIHRAAGPELAIECRMLNGCKVGDAKLTKGYRLQAPFVIHTVGPVWNGGNRDEPRLLASCYARSLAIAQKNRFETVAFPAISTGIYRFPADLAANIAVSTVGDFVDKSDWPQNVIFCCFSAESSALHQSEIDRRG